MPDPTDLRTICSALEHFSLPAALGNLNDDALVFWNQAFQKRAGFSEIELAQARLTSLILLDESYSGLVLQDHDPEQVVQFVPCVHDDGNLKALLVPYPPDQMRMWEISPRVNSPKNDDPSLWEPVHAEPTQTTTDALELLR
jgi:hypothetical protein